MSGENSNKDESPHHPARKVDHDDLKQVLAETMQEVPSPTTRIIGQKFSNVEPDTVKNNLEELADKKEVCRHSDGHVVLWWVPRDEEEGGDISIEQVLDDSVDYDRIDPDEVPHDVAESIAEARIPFFTPLSFWSVAADIALRGLILSLALVFLGIGEAIVGNFGLDRNLALAIAEYSAWAAIITAVTYLLSQVLHALSMRGHITKNPLPVILPHLPERVRHLFS